jgi:DNA-binding PadR family transcriptional regulator
MSEDAKARIEQMLREAAPILKQQNRTTVIPAYVLAKLKAVQEKKFPMWKELTSKEMAPLILKVLAQGKMDGFDLISRLEKAHIRIKGAGEAVNYGVLSKLVSIGFAQVDLEDHNGQMRKFYRLTDDGLAQLKAVEAPELQALAAGVLAAD